MLQPEEMKLETLYVGGGTPTFLNSNELKQMFKSIQANFSFEKLTEATIEINPNTCTEDELGALKDLGINRVSLGAQSFDLKRLKAMGREHTPQQVERFLEWCEKIGLDNVGIDLIYGLPNQRASDWRWELEQAISLKATHISLYGLKLEQGTKWQQMNEDGQLIVPENDVQAAMYTEAVNLLTESGYDQYEISNFALSGKQSKHNVNYWRMKPYLGIGPGASSNLKGKRWSNLCDLERYCEKVQNDIMPIEEGEVVTRDIAMWEKVALSLRLSTGLKLSEFNETFGVDFNEVYGEKTEGLIKQGLIENNSHVITLTHKGRLLGNEVFASFLL